MNIYTPIVITEEIRERFVPTRLYIKRHAKTGLRYLGKSSREDIAEYLGSGTRWSLHLVKHGSEFVVTDWISDWFTNPEELQSEALKLSEDFDVVGSEDWANLKPEYGLEGGPGATFSDEERAARSERASGENNPMYGTSRVGEANPFYGKTHSEESKALMGPKGQQMPESQRKATSVRMLKTNPMDSASSRKKLSETRLRTPKKKCPHCGVCMDPGNYTKHHGDNCRHAVFFAK